MTDGLSEALAVSFAWRYLSPNIGTPGATRLHREYAKAIGVKIRVDHTVVDVDGRP